MLLALQIAASKNLPLANLRQMREVYLRILLCILDRKSTRLNSSHHA